MAVEYKGAVDEFCPLLIDRREKRSQQLGEIPLYPTTLRRLKRRSVNSMVEVNDVEAPLFESGDVQRLDHSALPSIRQVVASPLGG